MPGPEEDSLLMNQLDKTGYQLDTALNLDHIISSADAVYENQ